MATGIYTDNSTQDLTSAVTWASDAAAVATVSNVAEIDVTPATPSIAALTQIQFTATAMFTDGITLDVSNSANWLSGDMDVAIIGFSTGLAISVAPGTTVILATYSGVTDSSVLIVTPAPNM